MGNFLTRGLISCLLELFTFDYPPDEAFISFYFAPFFRDGQVGAFKASFEEVYLVYLS